MKEKKKYTTEEIVEGILKEDSIVISYIYKRYYPLVQNMIILMSGSIKDAEDTFQNAFIVIFKKIQNEDLILTVEFKTYMIAVCKKMWLRQLKRKKIIDFKPLNEENKSESLINEGAGILDIMLLVEKNSLYHKHFLKLKKECQILLRLFYDKVKLKKIAEYFGLKNANQAKKKKYRCKEYLIESIKDDPLYNEYE